MDEIREIEKRREDILGQIRALRGMRAGTVSKQYFKRSGTHKEKAELRGPYWVHTRKVAGKTISQRLSGQAAEEVKKEVEAFHRFQQLGREYAALSERLGELERAAVGETPKKKRRRLPSSKTGK